MNSIKSYLKNDRMQIFEYNRVFILLFFDNLNLKSLFRKHNIVIINKDKLKQFYVFDKKISYDISVNYKFEWIDLEISMNNYKFIYEYHSNKNIKKLLIKERKNDEITNNYAKHIKDENTIENLIGNIKFTNFIESLYKPCSIYKYDDLFVVTYCNVKYNPKDSAFVSVYKSNIRKVDKVLTEEYRFNKGFITIIIDDQILGLCKWRQPDEYWSIDRNNLTSSLTKIDFNDVTISKNIIDDIEFYKEKIDIESKEINKWLNYYEKSHFYNFHQYDFKINYIENLFIY